MSAIINNVIKFFRLIARICLLSKLSIQIAINWPSSINIFIMRMLNGIQFSISQLKDIITTVKTNTPCNFLIFGLGNDSLLWSSLNKGGKTIFLEDNKYWFQKINRRFKGIKSFLVNYNTRRKDWKKLLENKSYLNMSLPDDIEKEKWDIILVDAPAGFRDEHPGRMKSIFISSKLIKALGDVFVHDCNREVEDVYCNEFLRKENLIRETKGKISRLRHYKYKQ